MLSLRREDRAVVEPLGRDSRFSTWFDQRLPVGHSQHSTVNQSDDTSHLNLISVRVMNMRHYDWLGKYFDSADIYNTSGNF